MASSRLVFATTCQEIDEIDFAISTECVAFERDRRIGAVSVTDDTTGAIRQVDRSGAEIPGAGALLCEVQDFWLANLTKSVKFFDLVSAIASDQLVLVAEAAGLHSRNELRYTGIPGRL